MNNKQSKKFRKQIRKTTNELSAGVMGRTTYKIARQRDIIFLIAVLEGVMLLASIIIIIWR